MAKKTKKADKSNPNDDLIGRKFYWSEPWEWDEDDENIPLDEDGDEMLNISGNWDVKSVHDDGETAWVHITAGGRDFEMEFPTSIIRSNLIYDEEKDG